MKNIINAIFLISIFYLVILIITNNNIKCLCTYDVYQGGKIIYTDLKIDYCEICIDYNIESRYFKIKKIEKLKNNDNN